MSAATMTDVAADAPAKSAAVATTDDHALLERLMSVTGELILVRNQLLELGMGSTDGVLRSATQRLDLLTNELQDEVMGARLQPVGANWSRLPKLVKDAATERGVRAQLQAEGRRTMVDARLVSALVEPVEHLLRLAVAGIEDPEARKAAGKQAVGQLLLRASDNGGQVVIQVADDGDGLGYDAGSVELVRALLDPLGGVVEVHAEAGAGTTARLSIPLELAIVPSVVVSVAGERFAVPQNTIIEMLRVDAVDDVQGTPVYRLRGELLALVDLGEHLGGPPTLVRGQQASVVVVGSEGIRYGVVVDGIHDSADLVVRPLAAHLKDVETFCGATVLADGHVALVLDIGGIAKRTGAVNDMASWSRPSSVETEYIQTFAETQALLVVRVAGHHRVGIATSLVARLEVVPEGGIERSSSGLCVQRDGGILKLVDLAAALEYDDARPVDTGKENHAVVCGRGDDRVGLLVDGVVDIVEQEVAVDRRGRRGAITGSAVVAGHVTDLVNVSQIIKGATTRPADA